MTIKDAINVTNIAQKINGLLRQRNINIEVKPKDINSVLEKLGFQTRDDNGTHITSKKLGNDVAGFQKEFTNKETKVTTYSVAWNPAFCDDNQPLFQFFKKVAEKAPKVKKEEEITSLSEEIISKELNVSVALFKEAVRNLKLVDSKNKLIKSFFGDDSGEEILWNDKILGNPILKKELDRLSSKKDLSKDRSTVAKVVSEFKADSNFKYKEYLEALGVAKYLGDTSKAEELQNLIKRFFSNTESGILVKSLGEAKILDYAWNADCPKVAYERKLDVASKDFGDVYSDFYFEFEFFYKGEFHSYRIFMELWGFENKPKYLHRKKIKQDIYKKSGVLFVELNYDELAYQFNDTFNFAFLNHPDIGLTFDALNAMSLDHSAKKSIRHLPADY